MQVDPMLKRGALACAALALTFGMFSKKYQPRRVRDASLFGVLDATVEALNLHRVKGPVKQLEHPYFTLIFNPGALPQDTSELIIRSKKDSPYASNLTLKAYLLKDKQNDYRVVYHTLKDGS